MRKTTTFKIEGYDMDLTVKELTVGEIIGLIDEDNLSDVSIEGLKKQLGEKILPLCIEGLTLNDILKFTPSELEIVWEKFSEVNSSFFALARKSGLLKKLDLFKEAFLADFSKLLAVSSKQDTQES